MTLAFLSSKFSDPFTDAFSEKCNAKMFNITDNEFRKHIESYTKSSKTNTKKQQLAEHTCGYVYSGNGANRGKVCNRPAKHQLNGLYYCGNIKEDGKMTVHLKSAHDALERSKKRNRAKSTKVSNKEYVDEKSRLRFEQITGKQRQPLRQAWPDGPYVRTPNGDEPTIIFDHQKMTATGILLENRQIKPLNKQAMEICRLYSYTYLDPDEDNDKEGLSDSDDDELPLSDDDKDENSLDKEKEDSSDDEDSDHSNDGYDMSDDEFEE